MADATNSLEEFSKYVDAELVEPLRAVLIGRKIVPVTPEHGLGVSAVEFHKIVEMGEGVVTYSFSDAGEDEINITPTTLKLPIHIKDYRIDRRHYESYREKGINIDNSTALSAAFVAANKEDATIIRGYAGDGSTYDIKGLYEGAGNTYAGSDFGTAGNPTDAVAGAMDALEQDDVPVSSCNLILHPTQRNELRALRNSYGIREEPEVLEMLNGGAIYSSKALTAGTGLLIPTVNLARPYFDYFLGVDWRTEHGTESEHPDTSDLHGRVYSTGVLRIKHDVAICTITGI
ncbi:hypothetical protein DRN97_03010 [Methanosarcinales archaeon]|nr:MAG: hypothetical protein DRN97_03010 [Methanosarcinales archaeon]